MIPLSELEKLRIGCERGNLKQVSATEFLALFAHLAKSRKDTERLDKLEARLRSDFPHSLSMYISTNNGEIVLNFDTPGSCPRGEDIISTDLRSAIDSLKKD